MIAFMSGIGFIGTLFLIFFLITLPISVYCAQKWAYKCFKELDKLNKKKDRCLSNWDELNKKMDRCLSKLDKQDTKMDSSLSNGDKQVKTESNLKKIKKCPRCGANNKAEDSECIHCRIQI